MHRPNRRRPTEGARAVLVVLAAAAVVSGCGDGGDSPTTTVATATVPVITTTVPSDVPGSTVPDGAGVGGGSSSGSGDGDDIEADLEVRTTAPGGEGSVRYEVKCPPRDADDRARCDALAADPDMFEPVPDDVACSMLYGGPETATVTGTFEGERIKAMFSRKNGCEISRWQRAAPVISLDFEPAQGR